MEPFVVQVCFEEPPLDKWEDLPLSLDGHSHNQAPDSFPNDYHKAVSKPLDSHPLFALDTFHKSALLHRHPTYFADN